MELREIVLAEHSKQQQLKIITLIGDNHERFLELMHLFLTDEYRVVQRVAWVMGALGEIHPEWFLNFIPDIIQKIKQPEHEAVKRNCLRILTFISISEEWQGELFDICFNIIGSFEELPAPKAYAIAIITKYIKVYPELAQELDILLQQILPHEGPAVKSKAKQFYKSYR
ncbi:MAG: hypothetical protein K1X55_14795 [Chitinophagales bacterium]|nr:hypothetical protein [Chitinophagales bacterium]